jgi:hypothetical protein
MLSQEEKEIKSASQILGLKNEALQEFQNVIGHAGSFKYMVRFKGDGALDLRNFPRQLLDLEAQGWPPHGVKRIEREMEALDIEIKEKVEAQKKFSTPRKNFEDAQKLFTEIKEAFNKAKTERQEAQQEIKECAERMGRNYCAKFSQKCALNKESCDFSNGQVTNGNVKQTRDRLLKYEKENRESCVENIKNSFKDLTIQETKDVYKQAEVEWHETIGNEKWKLFELEKIATAAMSACQQKAQLKKAKLMLGNPKVIKKLKGDLAQGQAPITKKDIEDIKDGDKVSKGCLDKLENWFEKTFPSLYKAVSDLVKGWNRTVSNIGK